MLLEVFNKYSLGRKGESIRVTSSGTIDLYYAIRKKYILSYGFSYYYYIVIIIFLFRHLALDFALSWVLGVLVQINILEVLNNGPE